VAVAVVALGKQPNGLAGMLYEAITSRGKAGREVADNPPAGNAIQQKAAVGAPA
jgi:hypothetical protein